MDPRTFLHFDKQKRAPAHVRTCISRAYYGAYLTLCSRIEATLGVDFRCVHPPAKLHWLLPAFLMHSGDNDLYWIGFALQGLRDDRNTSDYEMNDVLIERPGEDDIRMGLAEFILDEFEKLTVAKKYLTTEKMKKRYREIVRGLAKRAPGRRKG